MAVTDPSLAALHQTGTFKVQVVPTDTWFGMLNDQDRRLPWHDTVLRPLLLAAAETWAYGLDPQSPTFRSGARLLRRHGGKYRVDTSGDPISGCELFWNASGGKRGSIAMVIPEDAFPGDVIFGHCHRAFVVSNPGRSHSPSAVRFARTGLDAGGTLVCLLPETNGFEWFDVFARPATLVALYRQARAVLPGFAD